MSYLLVDFVRESNRIEGIDGYPPSHEIEAHKTFLASPTITLIKLATLVIALQPDSMLRDKLGRDVRVGNYIAPPGGYGIRTELRRAIDSANELRGNKGATYRVHHDYENLHPFTDGNGRSGRALWLWMMGGIENAPLGFLHHWYYQSLSERRLG